VLCPETRKAGTAPATKSASAPKAAPKAPPAQFAVGQHVEARYGREWLRGRVARVSQVRGAQGPEFAYEVRLDNGKRGVLPAHMLRRAQGR
jgi:hypothetical protein